MKNLLKVLAVLGLVFSMVVCENDDAGDTESYDDIENLCDDKDDMRQCVSTYFVQNTGCNELKQRTSEPIYSKETHYAHVPRLNATVKLINTEVSNLTGTIEKFFLNTTSKNLVLSVNFDAIYVDSREARLVIHKKGKEPANIKAHISGYFPAVLTAVLDTTSDLIEQLKNWQTGVVWAWLPQRTFDFNILPLSDLDLELETVLKLGETLVFDLATIVEELFVTGSADFLICFLQQQIADCGVSTSELI